MIGLTKSVHCLNASLRFGIFQALDQCLDGFFVAASSHSTQCLIHVTQHTYGGQPCGQKARGVIFVLQKIVATGKSSSRVTKSCLSQNIKNITYLLMVSKSRKVSPTVNSVVITRPMSSLVGGPGELFWIKFMSWVTKDFWLALMSGRGTLASDPSKYFSHSNTKIGLCASGRPANVVSFKRRLRLECMLLDNLQNHPMQSRDSKVFYLNEVRVHLSERACEWSVHGFNDTCKT